MKVQVETVVDGRPGAAVMTWGVTPEGKPAFVIHQGSHRVTCELEGLEARDFCCLGIHATLSLVDAARAAEGPPSRILAPNGHPLPSRPQASP